MRTFFLILRFTHQSVSPSLHCISLSICTSHTIFMLHAANTSFFSVLFFFGAFSRLNGSAHNFSSSRTVVRGACVLPHSTNIHGSYRKEDCQRDSVKWNASRDKSQAEGASLTSEWVEDDMHDIFQWQTSRVEGKKKTNEIPNSNKNIFNCTNATAYSTHPTLGRTYENILPSMRKWNKKKLLCRNYDIDCRKWHSPGWPH